MTGHVQLTVRLDPDVYATLRIVAGMNHRSIAAEVRRLIEQHVESETSREPREAAA